MNKFNFNQVKNKKWPWDFKKSLFFIWFLSFQYLCISRMFRHSWTQNNFFRIELEKAEKNKSLKAKEKEMKATILEYLLCHLLGECLKEKNFLRLNKNILLCLFAFKIFLLLFFQISFFYCRGFLQNIPYREKLYEILRNKTMALWKFWIRFFQKYFGLTLTTLVYYKSCIIIVEE